MSVSQGRTALRVNPLAGGRTWARRHPIARLVAARLALGVVTLWLVSVVIFLATQALPGNAAYAVLGRTATPARLHALEAQLNLNRSLANQYGHWIGGVARGNFGTSLVDGQPVASVVGPRLLNSAALVIGAGAIGILFAGCLGVLAAARRDKLVDHVVSVAALSVTALPEFVVAIALVAVFAVNVFHVLPAVSAIPAGESPLDNLSSLVLPIMTLALVIFPYIFRMVRGAMIEALESDYVEMAKLKGIRRRRLLFVHALPNALPPIIQVVGLNLLYLAGGIVVVEYVFNYPGIGAALVDAVSNRDIPTIQFIVLVLAAFYVIVNIATDVLTLLASPRRRAAR